MSNIINDNSIKETYIPLFILEEKAKMKQCSQKYIECICTVSYTHLTLPTKA